MSNMTIRSTSLPSRTHTTEIEEALNKVKAIINTKTDSSESILIGLAGLEELYYCMEEFLKTGSTQRVISSDGSEFMEEMLDGSLRLMDICSVSRDLMVETREHVRNVQSYVRRKKVAAGGNQLDVGVSGYVGCRKNMRKEAKKLLGSLKNIEKRTSSSSPDNNDQQDAVTDVMRKVVSVSVTVLKSLLEFLSGRQNSMKTKLASVLKRKKEHRDEETNNEFESLDSAICCCSSDDLQEKLEHVAMSIDGFEKNLEGLFRRLIRTRASFLNIISQ